jgi:hypothetical protein
LTSSASPFHPGVAKLSFQAVRNNEIPFAALVTDLMPDDLRVLTREMVDIMLSLITGCVDPNRFRACGRVSCYA